MKFLPSLARPLVFACLAALMAVGVAFAQQKPFEPKVGQAGRDVIWVPTPQALVNKMLDMADVRPGDFLVDLGSGDGRTVITAAKRGVRAMGVEYNPDMVELSRANAEKAGVSNLTTFVRGDLFKTDFSKATVVTMFLLSSINMKLRPTILNMAPGTRVVSNTFDMGDWQPDRSEEVIEDCATYCVAHFWVVPAKVQGTWKLPQGTLVLEQKFQRLSGTLNANGDVANVSGKMIGEHIAFSTDRASYSGRLNGDSITGIVREEAPFRATR
jgi:hypothetical protein